MNPAQLQLRDIHLPAAVSWWPPAPGWWLLVVTLMLFIAMLWWWRHHYQCRYYRRIALQQLAELEQRFLQEPQNVALVAELSKLLRHMAVLHFPASNCAGLQGEEWLEFLDRPFSDSPFSNGIGHVLAQGPYQRHNLMDQSEDLIALCRRWINQLPPVKPRRTP